LSWALVADVKANPAMTAATGSEFFQFIFFPFMLRISTDTAIYDIG
jgi:hypothetical protein